MITDKEFARSVLRANGPIPYVDCGPHLFGKYRITACMNGTSSPFFIADVWETRKQVEKFVKENLFKADLFDCVNTISISFVDIAGGM